MEGEEEKDSKREREREREKEKLKYAVDEIGSRSRSTCEKESLPGQVRSSISGESGQAITVSLFSSCAFSLCFRSRERVS